MSSLRPDSVAWRLKPPLVAMFAPPMAEKVAASPGNTPPTTAEVGASCTDCAVSAEEYQVTMRWDSSAPTPRMMPVRFDRVGGHRPERRSHRRRPRRRGRRR